MTTPVTLVNVGTNPNDNTGDPAQVAFTKINTSLTALSTAVGGGGGVVTVSSPDNSVVVAGSPGSTLALQIATAFTGAFNIIPGTFTYATLPLASGFSNKFAVTTDQGAVFSNGVYWQILYNITTGTLAIASNSPLTPAVQSVAYSNTLSATAGVAPYTWTLISRLVGTNTWVLSTAGVLTGTPGALETDTLAVQVSDATGAVAQKLVTLQTVAATTPAATPTFSPVAGSYTTTQNVTISCTTPSSTIYYTTNGSTPTTGSTVYTTPVSVAISETLKAIATAAGFTQSAVGSAAYAIIKPLGTDIADSLSYYSTAQPMLNLMKSAGQASGNYQGTGWLTFTSLGGTDTVEAPLVNYDSDGYPLRVPQAGLTGTAMLALVVYSIPISPGATLAYPSGVYRVQFTGTGTVVIDGADASLGSGTGTNGLTFANAGTGTVSFTFTASGLCSGGGGIRLWITASNPSNNGNQIRALSMVQNSLAASYDGGAIFHPNFLAAAANYSTFRYKDWLRTDNGEWVINSLAGAQLTTPSTALVLNANWKEASGVYPFIFQTGQVINGTCVFKSPNVTLASSVSANVLLNDVISIQAYKTSWAKRTLPTTVMWSTAWGIPHETCIAFSNLMNAHCWTNSPLLVSDADVTSQANLYHSTLNSNLNCYIELSNETWNSSGPYSYRPSYQLGKGVFAAGNLDNDYQLQFKGMRTAVLAELWKLAWGSTDFARCFPVYASMGASTYGATGLNGSFWTSPIDGYSGPPTAHPIKCIAIAPYFPMGGGLISAADANKILAQADGGLTYFFQALYSNVMTGGTLPGTLASMQPNGFLGHTLHGGGGYSNIDGYIGIMPTYPAMKLIGYEGGQQFYSSDPGGTTPGLYTWTQLLNVANRDARMGTAYTTLLNYWAANVGATQANILVLYNLISPYAGTSWGAIESVMQTISPLSSAPQRYQAEHAYIGA